MMQCRRSIWALIPAALVCFGMSGTVDLSYSQRQAVERQERNLKEAQKQLQDLITNYDKECAELDGMIVPPSLFHGYMSKADAISTKCEAIESDLSKSQCPQDHPNVKPLYEWVAEGRGKIEEFRSSVAPKLAEAERVADPKNYPDLDADFARVEEIGDAYRAKDFLWMDPEVLENLAREFPNVTTFFSETYARYKPLIVVTGGKNSPLYKRYEYAARSLNEFNPRVVDFYQSAQAEYPRHLEEARSMADKASEEKKPMFFTGGVRQAMEQAEKLVKLCCAVLPQDDERRADMWGDIDAVKKDLAAVEAELKELILAEARLPGEGYEGSDKEALRGQIVEAWQKKWPKDEVLGTRFAMKAFDRSVKWNWQAAESSWYKTDHSVLCVLVIVKTSDKIATTYPAYVNVDHLDGTSNIGVNTKSGEYVQREVLLQNL